MEEGAARSDHHPRMQSAVTGAGEPLILIGRAVFEHADDASRLAAFDRPVLLATGTDTAPFLRRIHNALASALPRARTTEMPAGHAPHIVSEDRFLDELAAFQASS